MAMAMLAHAGFGQDEGADYSFYIGKADNLFAASSYAESAQAYENAFATRDGKGTQNHRYNAACAHAMAGNGERAFYHLFYLAEQPEEKYKNMELLANDPYLQGLHGENKWLDLLEIVQKNHDEWEKLFDYELIDILDTVFANDQKYRVEMGKAVDEYGIDSPEADAIREVIFEKDAENQRIVSKILDEQGWLGADVVGRRGNAALFLVIQHADLDTREKYMPMLRKAVANGNARVSDLAMLEDRTALDRGELQIYGTQIGMDKETGEYYVLPLLDPDRVDERREEMELRPLAWYVKLWNIEWDVEEYKKKLPEYMEKRD